MMFFLSLAAIGGEELRILQPATPGVQLMVLPFEIRWENVSLIK